MGFKENLGNTLKNFARIFPGISDYQDKESLRGQDKIVREHLSEMLRKSSEDLDKLKIRIIESKRLEFLTQVELITKKISKLSDMIKHASYGYSPVFGEEMIDKNKLKQICDYDLSMASEIRKLDEKIKTIMGHSNTFLDNASLAELEAQLDRIETLIKGRKKYA